MSRVCIIVFITRFELQSIHATLRFFRGLFIFSFFWGGFFVVFFFFLVYTWDAVLPLLNESVFQEWWSIQTKSTPLKRSLRQTSHSCCLVFLTMVLNWIVGIIFETLKTLPPNPLIFDPLYVQGKVRYRSAQEL